MSEHPLELFVRQLNARSGLTPTEQQALLDLPGRPVQILANRDIVRLGERIDHSCLIVDGIAGRFRQTRLGLRQIVSLQLPGDMADLPSVVVPKASSALEALTTTTVLQIPHSALSDVADQFPAIAHAFWRECVIEASMLAEWVLNVGRRDAASAMAHLLAEVAWRQARSQPQDGMTFDFPVTQAHLADALGLTAVHVNRTLMELRRQKIVTVIQRRAQIHDWRALVAVGDFSPDYLHIPPPPEGHGSNLDQRRREISRLSLHA